MWSHHKNCANAYVGAAVLPLSFSSAAHRAGGVAAEGGVAVGHGVAAHKMLQVRRGVEVIVHVRAVRQRQPPPPAGWARPNHHGPTRNAVPQRTQKWVRAGGEREPRRPWAGTTTFGLGPPRQRADPTECFCTTELWLRRHSASALGEPGVGRGERRGEAVPSRQRLSCGQRGGGARREEGKAQQRRGKGVPSGQVHISDCEVPWQPSGAAAPFSCLNPRRTLASCGDERWAKTIP